MIKKVNFTEEIINSTKIDKNIINKDILYGSGLVLLKFPIYAKNNRNYAIDYNNNKTIELKIEDSFASVANYLKTIGWKKINHVFKIELKDSIPKIFKFIS